MWDLDTIHKMNSPEGIERQRRYALALNGGAKLPQIVVGYISEHTTRSELAAKHKGIEDGDVQLVHKKRNWNLPRDDEKFDTHKFTILD